MIRVYLHCLWMLFILDFYQRHRPIRIQDWSEDICEGIKIEYYGSTKWECSCGYNKK